MDVYSEWLGIPEGERPPDCYTLLRLVEFEDDVERIRNNYRKLNAHVRKYATGKYSVRSQELLNELARAMLCLTDPERKREYDESRGREFDDEAAAGARSTAEALVAAGTLSRAQAREAEAFAEPRGLSIRDAVVQLKMCSDEQATMAYAEELQRPFVNLADMTPDDEQLDLFPRQFVKRNEILPLFVDDDMLLVACAHEPDPELEDEIRLRSGLPMRAVIATPRSVRQGIAQFYAPGMRDEARGQAAATGGSSSGGKKKASRAAGPVKAMSQLSEGEQRERKQVGWLLICWGFIVPIMLDEFVLKPYILPNFMLIPYVPSVATFLISPAVVWYVRNVYWK